MKAIKNIVLLGIVTLSSQQTVKFTCGTVATKGNCAEKDFNQLTNTVTVTLDPRACYYPNEYCQVEIALFKDSAQCTKGYFQNKPKSYPGETCYKDDDCLGNQVMCVNNVCKREKDPEICDNGHADCEVGKFCLNNKCINQLSEYSLCKSSYECKNDLLCLEDICKPFFTGGNGKTYKVDIPSEIVKVCLDGIPETQVNDNTIKCLKYELRAGNKRDGVKVDSLECTTNSDCNGFTDNETLPLQCVLSFSTDGKHYCQEMRKIII